MNSKMCPPGDNLITKVVTKLCENILTEFLKLKWRQTRRGMLKNIFILVFLLSPKTFIFLTSDATKSVFG